MGSGQASLIWTANRACPIVVGCLDIKRNRLDNNEAQTMNQAVTDHRRDLLPSLGILVAAVMWGVFWIPVRGVERAGIDAGWTSVLIFAVSALALSPLVAYRWRVMVSGAGHIMVAGFLSGLAFALYTVALNLTDVVRVILLFYMTPLWSTLLGVFVLKEALTVNRVVGLLLAFSGLMIVLGVGYRFPVPSNLGDWLALLSGMVWSFASVKLFQGGAEMLLEKVFLFVFFALVCSVVLVMLPLGHEGVVPGPQMLEAAWIWLLVIAVLMFPMTFLTIWPTTLLSPGRVGMLLMADVVAGVVSAAMLTDETFGYRELIGTVLIVSAGIVEVARQQTIESRSKTTV